MFVIDRINAVTTNAGLRAALVVTRFIGSCSSSTA